MNIEIKIIIDGAVVEDKKVEEKEWSIEQIWVNDPSVTVGTGGDSSGRTIY